MNNVIHRCAESGNLEMVKQLVEDGANIDMIDENGMTALACASIHGHFDIVVYLVERSADIAHTDSACLTALHWACSNGKLASVKYLLKNGASITERCDEGATALLCASGSKSLEVDEYLLSSEGGASITEKDNYGGTALLWAGSSTCHPTMVQWLLEYGGAQITDTDNDGDSVWTYDGQDELPNLLRTGYTKRDDGDYDSIDGEYVPDGDTEALTAMLRVMMLHGGPPESLATAGAAFPADRAGWRAAACMAPCVSNTKAGPLRRALPAAAATHGPGVWLRSANHHRRALGHGDRVTPATRETLEVRERPIFQASLCAPT
jgi:hypothetical protein